MTGAQKDDIEFAEEHPSAEKTSRVDAMLSAFSCYRRLPTLRRLSLNSAIHSGIRKSRSVRSPGEKGVSPVAQIERPPLSKRPERAASPLRGSSRDRRDGSYGTRQSRERDDESSSPFERAQRPNHTQRLDGEEVTERVRARQGRQGAPSTRGRSGPSRGKKIYDTGAPAGQRYQYKDQGKERKPREQSFGQQNDRHSFERRHVASDGPQREDGLLSTFKSRPSRETAFETRSRDDRPGRRNFDSKGTRASSFNDRSSRRASFGHGAREERHGRASFGTTDRREPRGRYRQDDQQDSNQFYSESRSHNAVDYRSSEKRGLKLSYDKFRTYKGEGYRSDDSRGSKPSNNESRAYKGEGYRSDDPKSFRDQRRNESTGNTGYQPSPKSNDPLSIPYTTPASNFLYGHSVVTSALKSRTRKMYKLYVYEGANREDESRDDSVRELAKVAKVPVEGVRGDWLRVMDKMSAGRPHNGYILEASPLPQIPVTALLPVAAQSRTFQFELGHQTREDEVINGTSNEIKCAFESDQYPLVLLLDEVLDPGNLGSIMRSAHFLGASAIAVSTYKSAPISTVALKASAGSSEYIPLLSVQSPAAFIDASKEAGWKFYSTAASEPEGETRRNKSIPYISTRKLMAPLKDAPCVVMMGGEGEGLRWALRNKADTEIGIEAAKLSVDDVDSLNVSVASALIVQEFLYPRVPPRGLTDLSQRSELTEVEEETDDPSKSERLF